MRLNPRCHELRGAANPNQARYHCPLPFQFVDPTCRDTEDLGWKSLAEVVDFFPKWLWRFRFFNLKWYKIPELGGGGVMIRKTDGKMLPLTMKALKYIYINHGEKRVFLIWNHHVLVSSFRFIWIPMLLMGSIINILPRDRLYMSESDVYRRQILTHKRRSRDEKLKYGL